MCGPLREASVVACNSGVFGDRKRDATAPRQHKCNCADEVPAGFITRCSTKKVINPGKQVQLVKEWVSHTDGGNEVCFQHNKNITSVIGMQTRKLDATTVKERLRSYHQAILDGTIGDLMTDKGTYAWFKVADRPSRPSDGLGPYKLMPKVAGIFEISVEDQTRLCTYLGIDSESWDRAGSVVVDCFSWWTTEKYTRPPPLLQQLSPSFVPLPSLTSLHPRPSCLMADPNRISLHACQHAFRSSSSRVLRQSHS